MQFLVVTRRRMEAFSAEQMAPMLKPETLAALDLYREGTIRQIWHRGDEPGAAILMEAESIEALKAKLTTLPMYEATMIEAALIVPLKPYGGFGPQ
jgi:muconolactone delta-isomerase